MRLKLVIVTLLFAFGASAKRGYDYTPVLIHLNKDKQHDTVGFNLVEHLPEVIHKRILSGEVTLWGSPLKKIKISVDRLAQLEAESGTKFLENNDLFINEYWKLFRKQFEFHVTGFTFFNRSEDGKPVNYGFVDADDIKSVLASLIIPCNANGVRNLSYWDAILSKRYHFDLVKFGKVDFAKSPERSIKLKHQAFYCEKIKHNALVLDDEKHVFSSILKSGKYSKNQNYKIYEGLEKFLNENKQELFNLAEEGMFNHLDPNLTFRVDQIDIIELWDKSKDGKITRKLVAMTLVVNGKKLKTMNSSDLKALDFLIEFKPFVEYIQSEDYEFIITRVNTQDIIGFQAKGVQQALETKPWHLILYHKNEEK